MSESTSEKPDKTQGISTDLKLSIAIGAIILVTVAFLLFRNNKPAERTALPAEPPAEVIIKNMEQDIVANPTHDKYFRLGFVYLNTKQFEKAIAANKKAIETLPQYADAYLNLGVAYMGLNQPDSAAAAFEAVLRINPEYQLAKNNLKWAQEEAKKSK